MDKSLEGEIKIAQFFTIATIFHDFVLLDMAGGGTSTEEQGTPQRMKWNDENMKKAIEAVSSKKNYRQHGFSNILYPM